MKFIFIVNLYGVIQNQDIHRNIFISVIYNIFVFNV